MSNCNYPYLIRGTRGTSEVPLRSHSERGPSLGRRKPARWPRSSPRRPAAAGDQMYCLVTCRPDAAAYLAVGQHLGGAKGLLPIDGSLNFYKVILPSVLDR